MRSCRDRNRFGIRKEESDMGKMLLGITAAIAVAALATPASAKPDFVGIPDAKATVGFSGMPAPGFAGVTVHTGFGGGFGDGFGGDHRFDRRSGGSSGGVWVNGGEWAHYNNQTFNSNSYNDWWHEQPSHSQPAWVRNNQDCARPYFQGNVLTC
jgi:hypothetical protein